MIVSGFCSIKIFIPWTPAEFGLGTNPEVEHLKEALPIDLEPLYLTPSISPKLLWGLEWKFPTMHNSQLAFLNCIGVVLNFNGTV